MNGSEAHERRRRTTAFHEAGHAVIGIRDGFVLQTASIRPTDSCFGSCEWLTMPSGVKGIEVLAAGSLAVQHFNLSQQLDDAEEFSQDDKFVMYSLAMGLASDDERETLDTEVIKPAVERVKCTLLEPTAGAAILAVAAALLEREVLTGREVSFMTPKPPCRQ
jgi:hypothetical protein